MQNYNLHERAVLMRLSISLPGEHRSDPGMTGAVKTEHALGSDAGKWVKQLFPPEALAAVKKLDNEARMFHASVTLPFDAGIGILPAALIPEHGDKMREYANKRQVLVEEFLQDPQRWIDWAVAQHNGTFDPEQYPGCRENEPMVAATTGQKFVLDADLFREKMRTRFTFKTQPLPVPNAEHFSETVASLLGTDTQSVDLRVKDAAIEAQKELMRRLLEPVAAMANKLAEQPKKEGKDIVFRDTLVGNLADIARIAPALNLAGDPVIDGFVAEIEGLTRYSPDVLRQDKATRSEAQQKAADLMKRLEGYSL